MPEVPVEPDSSAAQFVLQYDPHDRQAFVEAGVPRAAFDLVTSCKGLPEKQEFFKRVIVFVEGAAQARLNASAPTGFGFWFSILTATAHLMQQAGYDIYSPADVPT